MEAKDYTNQILLAKARLEKELAEALVRFNQETGLRIDEIEVQTEQHLSLSWLFNVRARIEFPE